MGYFGWTVAVLVQCQGRLENPTRANAEANTTTLDTLTQLLKYSYLVYGIRSQMVVFRRPSPRTGF